VSSQGRNGQDSRLPPEYAPAARPCRGAGQCCDHLSHSRARIPSTQRVAEALQVPSRSQDASSLRYMPDLRYQHHWWGRIMSPESVGLAESAIHGNNPSLAPAYHSHLRPSVSELIQICSSQYKPDKTSECNANHIVSTQVANPSKSTVRSSGSQLRTSCVPHQGGCLLS